MPQEAGSRLGPYEILSPIGAGGMGEVYKARDPRLNRTVAIKVLPSHIAERPDLKQRFEREAQTIASLNHPHICVVYDVGQHEGTDFLVMEFLEGETLADRLSKGPLPYDQLITYAHQIVNALDKAHRHGVTHRDLKPGNIMLTKTGVKLLDFGLAKVQQIGGPVSQSSVPTIATGAQPLTMEGTILGTLQYMAPEQLEGKESDARSDIFALGSVLYEMATGRRAFEGKSQVSLIAAILEHDPPPVSAVQPVAPPLFDDIIRICLAKNPDERWQSAADLEHELKLLVRYGSLWTEVATPKITSKRERLLWAAGVFLAMIVAVFALIRLGGVPEPEKVSFELQLSAAGGSGPYMIALSPDGRKLVARITEQGVNKLFVRPIERVEGYVLQGTDNSQYPFWSPDSRFVGFFADGKLKKVDIFGAPPQTLADAENGRGGTWNRDGTIVFSPKDGPLFKVAASGGPAIPVTELNKARDETAHRQPRFLPDGIHFLYYVVSSKPEQSGVYVGSLNSKETKHVVASASFADFSPPDLLLFLRENTLMAQHFDLSRFELTGDPFPLAERVGSNGAQSSSGFTVSNNVLAYRSGGGNLGRQLLWIDHDGKLEGTVGAPAMYENPRISPDGKRLAVYKPDGGGDIWIIDLERGTNTRFTFDPAIDNDPVWSPDGSSIAFSSNRDGGVFNLYRRSSGGTGEDELLLKTPNNKFIDDWPADGKYILYEETDPKTKSDLWLLPLFGDRKPVRLLGTPFNEWEGSLSPDGRWLAYTSDENGSSYVYVQAFPTAGRKWQISTTRGGSPRWHPDGKELFYDAAGPMMAVDLTGTVPGELKAATPRELFRGLQNLPVHNYDIAPDGKRFLVDSAQNIGSGPTPIIVVLNWKSGLK